MKINIDELEIIRDLHSVLEEFNEDFLNLVTIYEEQDTSILSVPEKLLLNNILNLFKSSRNIEIALYNFKMEIDRKYWSEWKKKFPHVNEDYDVHNGIK